ncbi:MAG TPA: M43 family zinc metalloprotease [Bacteroidia bacterium]|nr:M43 family zinc metalloprotease [Bacteroidia bacterium]
MRKILLLTGMACAMMLNQSQAQQSHRGCSTMDHLQEQMIADPTLRERMNDIERETARYVETHANEKTSAITTIPVVFHVLYNTTAENISDARILEQLNVMNKDFSRTNADAGNTPSAFQGISSATNVQFCLAKRDPSGAATTGIHRVSTTVTSFPSGTSMKFAATGGADAWDRNSYLNFWVCNLGSGLLGFATFPGGTANIDGVVCLYSSVGGPAAPGTAVPYHLGRTATHEVGHWLNLYHIWGDDGSSCSGSDQVGDTPNQTGSNFGCPSYPRTDACTAALPGVMFMNYMDYTDDGCMNAFSAGQSARIDATINGTRASLKTSQGCVPVSTGCGVPAQKQVNNISQTGCAFYWSSVVGATSYKLQFRPINTTTWTTKTTTVGNYAAVGILTPGTTYQYRVRAVCGTVLSAYSSIGTFTTLTGGGCVDNYEPNETGATSKTIPANTDIFALIGTSGDLDYYTLTTVAPATKLKLTLTNLVKDYNLILLNGAATTLASSKNTGTADELIIYNATAAAPYRIKVLGLGLNAWSATSCYKLRVATSATNWVREDGGYATFDESDLSVSPNPTNSNIALMFESQTNGNATIVVYDAMGKLAGTITNAVVEGSNIVNINLVDYKSGLYFVELRNGDSTSRIKVVKQ